MQICLQLRPFFSARFIFFIIFFCTTAAEGEPRWRADANLQLTTYQNYRQLNQTGFSEYETVWDNYYEIASLMRFKTRRWLFEAEPEARILVSDGVGLPQTDPAFATTRPPERVLKDVATTSSGDNYETFLNLKRLSVKFSNGRFSGYIGRLPVSIGVLRVLPVWNKFARPSPTTIGPKYIFASDGLGFEYKIDPFVVRVIGIGAQDLERDGVGLVEATHYGESIETHILSGHWWEHSVAGLAFAADVGGYALRFEFLGATKDERTDTQVGIGAEAAFTEKISAVTEFVHQSAGANSDEDYDLFKPQTSRFLFLRAAGYGFLQLNYLIGAVTTVSAGGFMNLVDGSFYLMPKISWFVTESIEVGVEGLIPVGDEHSEFSDSTFKIPQLGGSNKEIGAPLQGGAFIKAVF